MHDERAEPALIEEIAANPYGPWSAPARALAETLLQEPAPGRRVIVAAQGAFLAVRLPARRYAPMDLDAAPRFPDAVSAAGWILRERWERRVWAG